VFFWEPARQSRKTGNNQLEKKNEKGRTVTEKLLREKKGTTPI